jgi:hypothetical protein
MLRRVFVGAIALLMASCSAPHAGAATGSTTDASTTDGPPPLDGAPSAQTTAPAAPTHHGKHAAPSTGTISKSTRSASGSVLNLSDDSVSETGEASDTSATLPIRFFPGLKYQDLPGNALSIASWTMGETDPQYEVHHIQLENQQMLLLETIGWDSANKPIYTVKDTLKLPALTPSDRLLTGEWCSQSGDDGTDPELIVIVKDEMAPQLTHVRQAWKADRTTGRFEAIAPQHIVCKNSGWDF